MNEDGTEIYAMMIPVAEDIKESRGGDAVGTCFWSNDCWCLRIGGLAGLGWIREERRICFLERSFESFGFR
jgi:hypothetical protein